MMSAGPCQCRRYVNRNGEGEDLTVDGGHDESDLGGIGGTGEVGVDLLGLMLIQGYETVQDVIASRGIVRSTFSKIRCLVMPSVRSNLVQLTFIVREVVLHRADRQLLLEAVDLVQKQDDGRLHEPP